MRIYMYMDLVLFLYMNSVCGFTSNHILERLNYIEDRINAESKFRRDDFGTLFSEIGLIKTMIQQSLGDKADRKDDVYNKAAESSESELIENVQMLKNGFKEEKNLNTRFRREITEIQKSVQNLKTKTDKISASLEDILEGIALLKDQSRERQNSFELFENEMPEIKQDILDLHAQFEQTKVAESDSFDKIENDTEEMKKSIEYLKHGCELCLKKLDINNNMTEKLKDQHASGKMFCNIGTNSVEDDVCNCSVTACPLPTTDNQMTTYNSCLDLHQNGFHSNGVYGIAVGQEKKVSVYCDMATDGGGWTVFQRRQDGSVNFFRKWEAYKTGFGILTGEFWLGNEYLNLMTENDETHELRIDLEDYDGNHAFAKYSSFKVGSGLQNYKLEVSGYMGNAGDSLIKTYTGHGPHNGMEFTTKDRDNDKSAKTNCASLWKGAWWFNKCYDSHLNGPYRYRPKCKREYKCIVWFTWKGLWYSLKFIEMKFR